MQASNLNSTLAFPLASFSYLLFAFEALVMKRIKSTHWNIRIIMCTYL